MAVWNIDASAPGTLADAVIDGGVSRVGSSGPGTGPNMNMQNYGIEGENLYGSQLVSGTILDPSVPGAEFGPVHSVWNQPSLLGIDSTAEATSSISYVWDSATRSPDIKFMRVLRTLHINKGIRQNQWNEFTGNWNAGFPENATSGLYSQALDINVGQSGSLVDDEAQASRSAPGEFAYRDGSPTVVQADYEAKTG